MDAPRGRPRLAAVRRALAPVSPHTAAAAQAPASWRAAYTVTPKFAPSDAAGARAYLAEHGYVILRRVLAPRECATALDKVWRFLEVTAGIDRRDPASWSSAAANLVFTDVSTCKLFNSVYLSTYSFPHLFKPTYLHER